jgi:hypothetical protein
LLRWSNGRGQYSEGVPWREELNGAAGALEALRRLEAIQLDPVNVVAPNHHLVLANRVNQYKGEHLEALYPAKQVFEYWAQARCILPIEDYGHFAARRKRWGLNAEKFDSRSDPVLMQEAVKHIRQRLKKGGALPLRAFESQRTTGYWGFSGKATSHAMERLWEAGEVVVARRDGDERHFALLKHHFPKLPKDTTGWEEQLYKFVRAYGVLDGSDPRLGWGGQTHWFADTGSVRKQTLTRLLQDGTLTALDLPFKRRYFIWSELLPMLEGLEKAKVAPEVFFIPPLDNLIWRRERIADLFGFDYKWEIYVPEPKRRYGPYVLPVLEGEALVARVDVRSNRAEGTLVLKQTWWESSANPAREKRVKKALRQFAERLGLGFAENQPPQ